MTADQGQSTKQYLSATLESHLGVFISTSSDVETNLAAHKSDEGPNDADEVSCAQS
jgi:hypothetical protein